MRYLFILPSLFVCLPLFVLCWEEIPFTYSGPVLSNVTREESLLKSTFEKIGTSGLSEEVKKGLQRLKDGDVSVLIRRSIGKTSETPPTPVSAEVSWEYTGPPEVFSAISAITNFLGQPLGYGIFGREDSFLRHVHPVKKSDYHMSDIQLFQHTDFTCFPMIPQYAVFVLLRADAGGRGQFYTTELDAALARLEEKKPKTEVESLMREWAKEQWSLESCSKAKWREYTEGGEVVSVHNKSLVFDWDPPLSSPKERDTRRFILPMKFQTVTQGGPGRDKKEYDALREALWDVRRLHRLRPGDAVVLDNTRAAHGREPFGERSKKDGKDRWIFRVFANDDRGFYSSEEALHRYSHSTDFFLKDGSIVVDQQKMINTIRTEMGLPQRGGEPVDFVEEEAGVFPCGAACKERTDVKHHQEL